MKKLFLLLGALALVGAGCTGGSTPADTGSTATQRVPSSELRDADKKIADRIGDASKVSEAEAKLGIDLPDDAGITVILHNARSTSVSGRSDLSVVQLRDFFKAEFAQAGLTESRPWGVVGASSTSDTATYRKGNETWAVFVREEGIRQTFEVQIQR